MTPTPLHQKIERIIKGKLRVNSKVKMGQAYIIDPNNIEGYSEAAKAIEVIVEEEKKKEAIEFAEYLNNNWSNIRTEEIKRLYNQYYSQLKTSSK